MISCEGHLSRDFVLLLFDLVMVCPDRVSVEGCHFIVIKEKKRVLFVFYTMCTYILYLRACSSLKSKGRP